MGKLLIVIVAIVIVLVILPGDIRDWCILQIGKLTAQVTGPDSLILVDSSAGSIFVMEGTADFAAGNFS